LKTPTITVATKAKINGINPTSSGTSPISRCIINIKIPASSNIPEAILLILF